MHKGPLVREVRLSRGMTQKDFASLLGVPQPFLSEIERQKKPVPDLLIARLKYKFSVPDVVLAAPTSPYRVGDLNFRTNKTPAAVQEAVRVTFSWMEQAVRNLLGATPFADLSLDGFEDRAHPLPWEVIEDAARTTRRALGIAENGPVTNVTRALERVGMPVVSLANPLVDFSAVDGVSSPYPGDRPVIATTEKEAGDRVRFTRAHELGHIVLHQHLRPGVERLREDEAHLFAGAFLFPAEDAFREVSPGLTPAGYAQIKARYGVSISALVRRARELGIIDQKRYRSLMIQISSRGWRSHEPVRVPVEKILLVPSIDLGLDQPLETSDREGEEGLGPDVIDLFSRAK